MPGIADRRVVGLDADDHPVRPDRWGQDPGEQARAAVQVEYDIARPGLEAGQHGAGQHVRRGGMHLPERSRADSPVPVRRVLAEVAPAAHRGQAAVLGPGPAKHRIRTDLLGHGSRAPAR